MQTPDGGLFGHLADALSSDWVSIARQNQLPPPGYWWRIWLLLAGRGFGKTRTICEFGRGEIESGRAARVAILAATAADARDVLVEGPAGILAISPKWNRPTYEPTKRRLSWPNGAVATLFSADEPERLRGPQHDLALCDELAAWRYPEAFDMLLLGLRLGKNPRVAIATTPRPTRIIRELIAREGKDVAVTRGSTLENRDNLAPAYIEQILERYKGTRLERQEVFGELLEDTPGALWSRENLEQTRVAEAPAMQRIVVAVDPAGSSEEGADETGIVVAGLGQDGHGYVLDDLSGRYGPTEWARRAIGAYNVWKADRIVAETNYGGEMVENTITAIEPSIPVKRISSSRGKVLRAEPVAAYFAQRRAHVVGSQPELEDQACRFTADWSRSRDGSPDRVDALVFALTELMLGLPVGGTFREAMLLEQGEPVPLPQQVSGVYAVIAPPRDMANDAVGVIWCAHSQVIGIPLTVLDWELVTIDEALSGGWIRTVAERLSAWRAACAAHSQRELIYLERAATGSALFEQGKSRSLQMEDLRKMRRLDLPPDLPGRATRAVEYMGDGRHVRISRGAHEKTQAFDGVTRNHLLAQVLTYRTAAESQPDAPLLEALCLACVLAFDHDEGMRQRISREDSERNSVATMLASMGAMAAGALQRVREALSPGEETAAPVAPAEPGTSILLTPGRHVIDGETIEIPRDGDRAHVAYPLPPGRHVVDDRLAIVHAPGPFSPF